MDSTAADLDGQPNIRRFLSNPHVACAIENAVEGGLDRVECIADLARAYIDAATRTINRKAGHDAQSSRARRAAASKVRFMRRVLSEFDGPISANDNCDEHSREHVSHGREAGAARAVVREDSGERSSGDVEPPPAPIERDDDAQRPACCPTCGARDHWHRRSRPMNAECIAQLGRAAVIRLRGRRS